MTELLIREILFTADAEEACNLFRLTISIKKSKIIGQGTNSPPKIKLGGESLKPIDKFVYLDPP